MRSAPLPTPALLQFLGTISIRLYLHLTSLYAITLMAVTILHFPCRWFAGVKARSE
jgi:hypothetical protein